MRRKSKKIKHELRAAAANGFTIARRVKFLARYAKTGNLSESALKAGVSRRAVYDWAKADKEFRKLMRDALAQAADALEAEARRRAVDGWDDPVFQGGQEVGSVRKYSDTLLTLLLKASKRRKYSDRTELSGDPKRPLKTESQVQIYIPDNGRGDVTAKEDNGDE